MLNRRPPPTRPRRAAPPAPSAAPATPAPSTAVDAGSCLQGRFKLARFVGVGASETYGTGEGGDVQVKFDDGTYVLTGRAKIRSP